MGSIPSNPRWPGADRGVVGADTISLTKHWNSFCRYSSRAFSGREEVDTCEGRAFFPRSPLKPGAQRCPLWLCGLGASGCCAHLGGLWGVCVGEMKSLG